VQVCVAKVAAVRYLGMLCQFTGRRERFEDVEDVKEELRMTPTVRNHSGFGTSIFIVNVVLFLLVPQISFATASKVAQLRIKRTVPKATVPKYKEPATSAIFNHESGALFRLQDGQNTLAKQTADFDASVRQRLSQLSVQLADSQKETRLAVEETNQRLGSAQRLLKAVTALLVLLLGGLLYVAAQLARRPQDNSITWRGKVPEPDADDEGIVSWRTGETANGPVRSPGFRKDTPVLPGLK
jgi:hypothetical protein